VDDEWDEEDDDEEEDDTIPCPYCRRPIYEDSQCCPYCGEYILEEDAAPARRPWWIIVGVLLAFCAIFWWIRWGG
jgi:hypothetical protein